MKQLAPLVYQWSAYDPNLGLDLHGYFIQSSDGSPGAIVDPIAIRPTDARQITSLGGAGAILFTSTSLARERWSAATACAETLRCPVQVPRTSVSDASYLLGAQPIDSEATLPAGLSIIPVPNDSSPDQIALGGSGSLQNTIFAGSAVTGSPAGQISLPAGLEGDPAARAARALRALLGSPVDCLLPATGFPVFRDASLAIQDVIYRHDPEAFILRPGEAPPMPAFGRGIRFATHRAEYTLPLGLRTHDFCLSEVPPRRQNAHLHRHDGKEELFIVLSGCGDVLTDRGRFPIHAGDVLAFPPRYQIAHAVINTGDEPLRYFAFGAYAETIEMIDYVTTGIRMERADFGKTHRFYLPERLDVPYWENEPADEPVE